MRLMYAATAHKSWSVGETGLGIFGASRRSDACTPARRSELSNRDGGISLRTSAKPNRMYPRTARVRTASVQNTPRRKYFIFVSVQGIRLGPEYSGRKEPASAGNRR